MSHFEDCRSVKIAFMSLLFYSWITFFKTQEYIPICFDKFVRSKGCHNINYFGSCEKVHGGNGCLISHFETDLAANLEYCIYHGSDLNLTTCFVFDNYVYKYDINYFIQRIVWFDMYNIFGPSGRGISTRAWAQGQILNNYDTYATLYGLSMAQGDHRTFSTTLPASPFYWDIETDLETPICST